MEREQHFSFEKFEGANLEIRKLDEDYRTLDFDSQDPKVCKAYIAAIADILSRMWPDAEEFHPQHIKEILLEGHVFNGEISGGYFSFPLNLHDAVMGEDDKTLLDKIRNKAREIYQQIA